jgi:hypothetical protein
MSTPSSIRFEAGVNDRLASYVTRHPGWTRSSAAARLVDEGLRMEEHPGVIFREGPAGRRACLIGGPDVWEVIRSVMSSRAAEPDLSRADLVKLVEDNTGVPGRLVSLALAYWAAHPEEIDALVAHAERLEDEALRAAEKTTELLGR